MTREENTRAFILFRLRVLGKNGKFLHLARVCQYKGYCYADPFISSAKVAIQRKDSARNLSSLRQTKWFTRGTSTFRLK